NGTPGHGQEECKVLEYTTVCENKPGIGWCENKKTSCVPKDCAKYMGAGYHLAGNNYPGYNRCACVKDCGPNTCPVPTCKKQICDPTSGSLPGNGGGVSPRSLSTCGVQNITGEKSVCNFSTGVWQCSHETDPCVAVSPEDLGDPCDGRPTHPDAVEGNTCGIKRIDLCRINDSCSGVDATTKCVLNTDVGNKCFTGEITTNGCSNGHYKTCEDCKWSECSSCDLNTKPESQEKECMTADGRCGTKILTNAYCDNGNWVFADDPNIECDGHYGLAPNNPPNSIWVAGNCFKQHQEWQCKISGWEAVPTGPYYTDNQTGVWVGGGLFGQMHFHANNCSNDNKDINGNPLPSGVWCENCIQHKCPESAVRNVHYGNKCWKSFKDDYVLALHNSLVVHRGDICMTRFPPNFLACATGFVNSQIGHTTQQCQQSNIWQCNPTNSPYLGEREVIQVSSEELINYCATASYPTKLATDYVLSGNIPYQGIIPCLDGQGAWLICSPYEIPNANFDVCSELPSQPIYSD
ncbi:MAG: hypothetical protein II726_00280, partial [Elusimicrobiaceae bacterium]|nr:hypothetical protein [Elusimicrobiaceae bacterium]